MRNPSLAVILVGALCVTVIPIRAAASVRPKREPGASASTTRIPPNSASPTELRPDQPVERQLKGGETHSYWVDLQAGQFMQVMVEQMGIDVVVALVGPDGKPIVEMDSPNGAWGPERVSLVSETVGSYRVDVRSNDKQARPGRYQVKVLEFRRAGPRDCDQVAAERVSSDAGRQNETARARIDRYARALALYRSAGDRAGEASTLPNMAAAYIRIEEYLKALKYCSRALTMQRALGDRAAEARTTHDIGGIHLNLGQNQQALQYFNQALRLTRALGDRAGEARVTHDIGGVYLNLGQNQQALQYFKQALRLTRALGDRVAEANMLNNIAVVCHALGEKQKALEYYNKALPIARVVGNRAEEVNTLANIGNVYANLGEEQKALDHYEQAWRLARAVGGHFWKARTLVALGSWYNTFGDKRRALDYYNRALPLARALGGRGERALERVTLIGIGVAYDGLGEKQEALNYFNQGLALERAVGYRLGEAITLNYIGTVYASWGDRRKALDYYNQALPLARMVGDAAEEARTLDLKAQVEVDENQLERARSDSEAALNIIETLRTSVISQELRASYFSTVQGYYELYIDILMHLHSQRPGSGQDGLALEASERGRSRSLLEELAEAHADIRQGVDADLLLREHDLQQLIDGKAQVRPRLLDASRANKKAAATLKKEIGTLLDQYQHVEERIRATSPRYAALTQPRPLSAREIQKLLDPNTLLLEYSLGGERSYLWAVTPDSLTSYTLPKRDEIERLARLVYDLLTVRNSTENGETDSARAARLRRDEGTYPEAAGALSQMILGSVASRLSKKRLLVVADGALQYIPFQALPEPSASAATAKPSTAQPKSGPLVLNHEIVMLPSASALDLLRKETAARPKAPKLVAVLADPVFDRNDPRVRGTIGALSEQPGRSRGGTEGERSLAEGLVQGRLLRSASDVGIGNAQLRFPRLVFTRREANAIMAVAVGGERKEALDFEASRAEALNPELSQYRIVHFATHGLLDSEHPELSGLVLTLVNEEGKSQNGFVELHDIYNLNLGADLVVLSACETGLGKEIKGEGLISLTRGFMYAGAPRVVASLWKVDDVAAAELMKRFYRGMLQDKKRPAAALRDAQIEMWKQRRWESPYYWAAFTIQGDWR